jgi:hypothetical protein
MKDQSYTATIMVANSPADVFEHLTAVSKWWGGADLSGSSARLNDEFTIKHEDAHFSRQKVTEFIPGKRLVWLVAESKLNWLKDDDEWTNTRMIFDIGRNGEMTTLKFTHEGLVPTKECYSRCTAGWDMVICRQLRDFLAIDSRKK